jgi:diamine N-acetyltransferase
MISLRELSRNDVPILNEWRQIRDLVDSLGTPFRFVNIETDEDWFSNYMKQRNHNVRCAICLSETKCMVGVVYLLNIDQVARSAEYGIMIGSQENRGKGIGTEATKLILSHAFEDLNLNRVQLRVNPTNKNAIALYLKCGFREEGRLREVVFKNGRYEDLLVMGILKSEFKF